MQKDSPGKAIKGRNERYTTAAQPKLLSLSSAKKKAADFAAKNDKTARVGAKKAILRELNSHLAIRAQGIFPREENENPYEKHSSDGKPHSHPKHTSLPPRGKTLKGKEKSVLQAKEKMQPKPQEYNWNKGGRQQELRIRCIARKFLFLWLRNVYGRVHPHVARTLYNNNLKHHVLRVWQDIWWSGRKGWKLNIRAEYHDRYRTWLKVWRAWRVYVMQKRDKKEKKAMAVQHANRKLQEIHFEEWTKYIKNRRLKRGKMEGARNLAVTFLKRFAFHQWIKQLEIKREQKTMEGAAMQYWAYRLLVKCWSTWTSALELHLAEKSKQLCAEQIAKGKLLIKVWRAWKNYRATRKLKDIQKRVADRHYNVTMVAKILKTWNARLHRRLQLVQFEDLIQQKGIIATVRRALIHWKFYITLQQEKHAKQSLALVHYETHLKRTVFDILHLQIVLRRLKNMRSNMSKDFLHKLLLKKMWTIWLKRCEHSEELKIYPLTRKARSYYRLKLLCKAVQSLRMYCKWRRHRKQQYYAADRHYRYHALPRFFRRIEMFVHITKEKKENMVAADGFRREVLLAKTFYQWHHEYQITLDLQMMNRMAILHHDEVTKRCYITIWLNRTRRKLQEHQLQAKADDYNGYRLMHCAFHEWRLFTRNAKMSRSHHCAAVRHHYLNILRNVWSSWTKYVEKRQRKWRKQAIADIHYQHTVMRKLFLGWKTYSARSTHIMYIANQRFREHKHKRLRELFSTWHHFAAMLKNDRLSHDKASKLYQTTIKRKMLITWRQYTYLHALKAEEKFIFLQEKRTVLDQGKLRRALRAWFVVTQESLHEASLLTKSDQHYRRVLLHKLLDKWKCYVHLCFRIKILCRQSMWLHNHRITFIFLRRWKQQLVVSRETKKKTSLSLWHWSVNLQRKAFNVWLMYAISKKQKQERIGQALQLRRTRLLKTGATQWIKVAFHLASERSRYSQVRHVEEARSLHQYVYKCAMHWRQWTKRRLSHRGGQPKETRHRPEVKLPSGIPHRTVTGNMPDLFKARPKPRVPDYLRESFDVFTLGNDVDKAPLSSLSFNLVPVSSNDDTTRRNMGAEELPRPGPPSPCPEQAIHPLRRTPGQDSMIFLPSSEGEGDSFIVRSEQKKVLSTTVSRQPLDGPAQTMPNQNRPQPPLDGPEQTMPNVRPQQPLDGPEQTMLNQNIPQPPLDGPAQTMPNVRPQQPLDGAAQTMPNQNRLQQPLDGPAQTMPNQNIPQQPLDGSAQTMPNQNIPQQPLDGSAQTMPNQNIPQQPLDGSAQTMPNVRPQLVDTLVLLPPSSFESRPVGKRDLPHTESKGTANASPDSSKYSFSPQSSDHSNDHSYASSSDGTDSEELGTLDLQAQIFDARKKLQKHYDLKIQYRTVKRRRDELQKALSVNQDQDHLQTADTQLLLAQLTEETNELLQKIQRNRPLVEDLARNINKMIDKLG